MGRILTDHLQSSTCAHFRFRRYLTLIDAGVAFLYVLDLKNPLFCYLFEECLKSFVRDECYSIDRNENRENKYAWRFFYFFLQKSLPEFICIFLILK